MSEGNGLSDESVVRRVLGGDVDAYATLVERYRARLLGLAIHLCGDRDTAMDLAQETLVAAYGALDRLREPAAFGGWVSAILRNKFRSWVRKKRVPMVSLDQLMDEGFEPPSPERAPSIGPEDRDAVRQCVRALPGKYRQMLMLRYVDDLSYKEIAATAGLPVTTVTTRLTYARRALIQKAKEGGLL